MKIPAYKVVGDVGKPGQIVNSFDRYPYLKHSTAEPDQSLSDYLTRKKRYAALDTLQPLDEVSKKLVVEPIPKMTFEDWVKIFQPLKVDLSSPLTLSDLRCCWLAAQENV